MEYLWKYAFCVLFVAVSTSGYRLQKSGHNSCGRCDQRACKYINPHDCQGMIVRDECNCCPVCDSKNVVKPMIDMKEQGKHINDSARAQAMCARRKCRRSQICVLNIQGIAVCRCPSIFWCRHKEPVNLLCGKDGVTYKSRCYIKHVQCTTKKKIKVLHRGACAKGRKRDGSAPGSLKKNRDRLKQKKRRKHQKRIARRRRVEKLKKKIRQLKSKKNRKRNKHRNRFL